MKRIAFGIVLGLFVFAASAQAKPAAKAAKKEVAEAADTQKAVTLSGQIGCGMCAFKVTKTCNDAIRVKEDGKEVVYLFAADAARKHDMAMCKTVRDGKVTGVVSEEDGKKTIKVSKIEFAK
jgi:preprotein translocase subunit YajC